MYIIPHQTFRGLYDGVLRLLKSERHVNDSNCRLLIALSKVFEHDSKHFPSQKEIGFQIGVSEQQVGNIIRALKKKGLIEVIPPGKSGRHAYSRCNSYRFLYHDMYAPFMDMDEKTLRETIKNYL